MRYLWSITRLAPEEDFYLPGFSLSSRKSLEALVIQSCLEAEVTARRERYLSTRIKLAHLPFQRTLE